MKRILLVSAFTALCACSGAAPTQPKTQPIPRSEKIEPRVIVPITPEQEAEAKRIISGSLKDPYSALFDDLYGASIAPDSAKSTVICGMVNAKNGFGGYAGPKKFAQIGRFAYIWGDDQNSFERIDNNFITTLCTPDRR